MSDQLPTVWPREPHTEAKHTILITYLQAWSAILARQSKKVSQQHRELRFIDAFAGPGVYSKGEPGSPVLAIDAMLRQEPPLPVPVRCSFIEKDPARFASLRSQVAQKEARVAQSPNLVIDELARGDCVEVLEKMLDQCQEQGETFGPALVFLDQFGYSDVPMTLISRIMQHRLCEVYSYLDYAGLNRFLSDGCKDAARNAAFGTDDWRQALQLPTDKRRTFLLGLYKRSLQKYARVKFVWSFAMSDRTGRPIYWLFFCTNNIRGLEEMKKAMCRVDDSGMFRFSDADDPDQLGLLPSFDDNWLSRHLQEKFRGQVHKVVDVKTHVLSDTPCCNYANVLQQLKRSGRVRPVDGNKKISFTRDLDREVEFVDLEPREDFSELLFE